MTKDAQIRTHMSYTSESAIDKALLRFVQFYIMKSEKAEIFFLFLTTSFFMSDTSR